MDKKQSQDKLLWDAVRCIKFYYSNGPSRLVLQHHEMAWNHEINQYVSLLSRTFHLPIPIFRIFLAYATTSIWRPALFGVLLLSLYCLSFHFLTYTISIDQSAPGGCKIILSRHYTHSHHRLLPSSHLSCQWCTPSASAPTWNSFHHLFPSPSMSTTNGFRLCTI